MNPTTEAIVESILSCLFSLYLYDVFDDIGMLNAKTKTIAPIK